ncbi:MAG TPA: hypothetical protein VFB62_24145, partial [Polyangiaceae bacterium]|nr:hypothetical protein [Polyangiaceae bacterium]
MAEGTLTRGRLNTRTDIWGQRNVPARPLFWCLLIALVLHIPALPTHFSTWIRMLFGQEEEPDTGPQQEVIIPIEFDLDTEPGEPGAKPSAKKAEPEKLPDEPDEDLSGELLDDDEKGDEQARKPLASADRNIELPDAGEPDPLEQPVAEAKPPPPQPALGDDPHGASGGVGGVRSDHPNVEILIAADVLRQRADLAAMFGELLGSVPEWNDLLGGTKLNPIQDFDHLFISAPQLRNPRWIVVAIEHNVPAARMRQAVERVVSKSKQGKWLEGHDLPVAQIGNEGERRVVLNPDKRLLVVLPVEAENQIANIKSSPGFAKSGSDGMLVKVLTPWRAFKSGPFKMPQSIKWMKIRFRLVGTDDFEVEIEAEDESAEAAGKNVRDLERQIEALRPIPGLSLLKRDAAFIGRPKWEVDGTRIRAKAPASRDQIKRIMRLI